MPRGKDRPQSQLDDSEQQQAQVPQLPSMEEMFELPERAYRMHLLGLSYRTIGKQLDLDKDTVQKYVHTVREELAAEHASAREQLYQESVERLHDLRRMAYTHYLSSDDIAALGILRQCEVDLAKLQGLYGGPTQVVTAEANGSKLTITYVNDWRGRDALLAQSDAAGDDAAGSDADDDAE